MGLKRKISKKICSQVNGKKCTEVSNNFRNVLMEIFPDADSVVYCSQGSGGKIDLILSCENQIRNISIFFH